jgi:hypothetical protein
MHGEMRNTCKIFVSQKGRDHSEDLGVGGRIILKLILGKLMMKMMADENYV